MAAFDQTITEPATSLQSMREEKEYLFNQHFWLLEIEESFVFLQGHEGDVDSLWSVILRMRMFFHGIPVGEDQ